MADTKHVALVESLDSPPLLIGHSLGGLVAQLVAARTQHAGLVAACTAPAAGIFSMYPSTARIFLGHYLQPRPWDKPLYPTTWKVFRRNISNTHTEQAVREIYDGLVCAIRAGCIARWCSRGWIEPMPQRWTSRRSRRRYSPSGLNTTGP